MRGERPDDLSDDLAQPGPAARRRGTVITSAVVVVALSALALTLLGSGAIQRAAASYDASSWLWSSTKAEVARVNGATGRVDTRFAVPHTQNHLMQVSQTDKYLILRDLNTGQVTAIDLSTLTVTADTPSTAGLGTVVALQGDAAFIIDLVQGVVRQIDPVSLIPIGEPLRFPPGIVGGVFDGTGRLWLAVPSEGTVVSIKPAARTSPASSGQSALAATNRTPTVDSTRSVSEPSHDIALSGLDDGVAVLDQTAGSLLTVRAGKARTTTVALTGSAALPDRTSGPVVPITVADDRHVIVVQGDSVHDFTVPGEGSELRPAVAWAGWYYCPDDATGTVYVLDADGRSRGTIQIPAFGGVLDLEVREDHLFINAPNSSVATVVDNKHAVTKVDKYADGILGGAPPPTKNPPSKPPQQPGPPGAPTNVVASAGNASAHISWGPAKSSGSTVTSYVIEGDGQQHTVGAKQRSIDITGLVNGKQYKFTVYAVNAKGKGPKRAANPVVPTSDVPNPPASVTATANPDGTVNVTWPAANGLGRKIASYTVSSITGGTIAQAGTTKTTTLKIKAGDLTYGTQYAFSVISVNDKGGSSKASGPSNTVVPFAAPGRVQNLAATTVANQAGAIRVTWQAAADNGRPIQGYEVDAGTGFQPVATTSVTLTGLGDGTNVTVKVHAINVAGKGPDATDTARTVSKPVLTLTSPPTTTYTGATFAFTLNNGGGATTCTVSVNGGPPTGIGCSGGPIRGLWPGNGYTYTFRATNPAGFDAKSGSISTPALAGTVVCTVSSYCGPQSPNGEGVWLYSSAHQSPSNAVGNEYAGYRATALCWRTDTQGSTINATPWGGKSSGIWTKVNYHGSTAYIPYAWFRLDAGETGGGAPSGILPGPSC